MQKEGYDNKEGRSDGDTANYGLSNLHGSGSPKNQIEVNNGVDDSVSKIVVTSK